MKLRLVNRASAAPGRGLLNGSAQDSSACLRWDDSIRWKPNRSVMLAKSSNIRKFHTNRKDGEGFHPHAVGDSHEHRAVRLVSTIIPPSAAVASQALLRAVRPRSGNLFQDGTRPPTASQVRPGAKKNGRSARAGRRLERMEAVYGHRCGFSRPSAPGHSR